MMEDALFLRETTQGSDVALIAWDVTSKRVLGDGIHFDMIADTEASETAMRDMATATKPSSGDDDDDDDDDEDSGVRSAPAAAAPPPLTTGQHLLRHANKKRFDQRKRVGEGGDSIALDDIFSAVRVEWNAFVEELDLEILRQNFALVTSGPSEHHPDILVPKIEDIQYYTIYQRYVPRVGYEYLATWSGLSQDMERMLGVKNDDIIEDAVVLMGPKKYAPDGKGELHSKMATAAPLIAELEAAEENIAYGLYWSTHRPWVPQLGPVGTGTAKGAASSASSAPPYANFTQLMANKDLAKRFQRAQKLDDHDEMHEDAYRRHTRYQLGRLRQRVESISKLQTHSAARARSAFEGNTRHALNPPYMNEYPMEAGDTIAAGPEPKLPAQTRENKNDIARRAFLALSVQPQLVGLEHANHAANSDIAFAGQNEAILNRQRVLEPLLAKAFRYVYSIDLDGVDGLLRSREMSASSSSVSAVEHSAKAVRTRVFSDTGEANRVSHRIRARLCSDPLTTPTNLENMLKTHVIDHGTYKELSLKSACVSTHLAAGDRVTMDQVDTWYGNGAPEVAASAPGTQREINGGSKKRSAAVDD